MTNQQMELSPAIEVVHEPGLIVSAIKYEKPVGKRYEFKNGKVVGSNSPRSPRAVAETIAFSSLEDFAIWRKALPTECMLVSGTFDAVGTVPVVYKGKESGAAVSATKKYLAHREQPGIMIVDIDYKRIDEVAGLYLGGQQPYKTHKEALNALFNVLPELSDCALMIGWSTSSNIFDKAGSQVKSTGGIRIYIPVTDASKIPYLLDIMHKLSWLYGEGWAFVGVGGSFEERSLVDKALERVTQPDFAAPALRDGLKQDREWQEHEGKYLDPDTVPPLTAEEEVEYLKAVAVAEVALAPAMKDEKERWLEENTTSLEKRGVTSKLARAMSIQCLENGVLSPPASVIFDDGSEVGVFELLTNGAAYDGKTCKDPVDPDYRGGASVGKFFWNDGDQPRIHSYAHGSKSYSNRHNAESLNTVIANATKEDFEAVIIAFKLTDFVSETEKVLAEKAATKAVGLGVNVNAFRNDVAARPQSNNPVGGGDPPDGIWPMETAITKNLYPYTDGKNKPIAHMENYKFMLSSYGISVGYDVIKKDAEWSGPGLTMDTDNAYLGLHSKVKSLAALNGVPHGDSDLHAHLPAIADLNQINPVRDYLSALEWDGNDRFEMLAKGIGVHDIVVAEIALRIWFTGAAAACEHFETGVKLVRGARPSFEYVLALLGSQGINKTKGFLGLVPSALSKYAKDGLSLNPKDKDSVKIAVSNWLVELGELDSTFSQGKISDLKAFLSNEADELRLPYAQGYSKYKRRTAFIGTVNHDKFLKDNTGNRRYLPLKCTQGFPSWSAAEVDQLWAQAWSRYMSGSQWWPTAVEQMLLDANAETFRQKSWAEQRLEEVYDWGLGPDGNKRTTATDIWMGINSYGGSQKMSPKEQSELPHGLKRLWSENGAYLRNGVLVIDVCGLAVKVNAVNGSNRGWLLPPWAVNLPADGESYE